MASDPTATCEHDRCRRKGHYTHECGLGEFRDHPENPELPRELVGCQYPWQADTHKIPFGPFYYFPELFRRKNGDPPLPDEYAETGLPAGLKVRSWGMKRSLDQAVFELAGNRGLVDYDPLRHGGHLAKKFKPSTRLTGLKHHGFDGIGCHPKLPSPRFTRGSANWFSEEFVAAMKKCIIPVHKTALNRIQQDWVRECHILQSSRSNQAIRAGVAALVSKAWDEIYSRYAPYWTEARNWHPPAALKSWLDREKDRISREGPPTGNR